MYKVGDFATRNVVIAPADWTVQRCARDMEQRHLRHLPIVDEQGRPKGMVTDVAVFGLMRRDLYDVECHKIARPWIASVHQDTPVQDALTMLAFGGLDACFVVDDDGKLVGLFTEHDAVRLAGQALESDDPVAKFGSLLLQAASVKPGTPSWAAREAMHECGTRHLIVVDDSARLLGVISLRDLSGRDASTVDLQMHAPVLTLNSDATIGGAVRTMVSEGIGCLPVVGPDRTPLGVITRTDVIRALLDEIKDLD